MGDSRKVSAWLLVLPALPLLACAELRTVRFNETASTTIEQGTVVEQFIGTMGFGDFINMDISENTTLKNQGIERAFIDSAQLLSATLAITAPAQGQDFAFVESVAFLVSADGVPEERIASYEGGGEGQRELFLVVESLELQPYVAKDSVDIRTEASGRRPAADTTVLATLEFEVLATIPALR